MGRGEASGHLLKPFVCIVSSSKLICDKNHWSFFREEIIFCKRLFCFISHNHQLLRIFIFLDMFPEKFILKKKQPSQKLFTLFVAFFLTTPRMQMILFLVVSWLLSQCLSAAVFHTIFWLFPRVVGAGLCHCSPARAFVLPGQQGLPEFPSFLNLPGLQAYEEQGELHWSVFRLLQQENKKCMVHLQEERSSSSICAFRLKF